MEEAYLLNHHGVKKTILHGGEGHLPYFPNGTKVGQRTSFLNISSNICFFNETFILAAFMSYTCLVQSLVDMFQWIINMLLRFYVVAQNTWLIKSLKRRP